MRGPLVQETPCNLCGAADYEVIAQRDREGRPLRTTICRRCGLVWTNPRPPLDVVDEYYRRHYRHDYKRMRVPTTRKLLRGMLGGLERRGRLLPLLRPGTHVLDVGCGAGEFVYTLRAAGFDARGLEPDGSYADYARKVLNIPVETGAVGDPLADRGPFDVVTMFHALEHVGDPVQTVRSIARSLKTSGLFFVEVPNVEAVCQAPHHRFHYAHLFSFSRATLAAVAARAGLTPVRVDLSTDGGNIIAVFRKRYTDSGEAQPTELLRQYEDTMRVLRGHTVFRHYRSVAPYVRLARRVMQRRREDRLLRKLRSTDDILRWVNAGALDEP